MNKVAIFIKEARDERNTSLSINKLTNALQEIDKRLEVLEASSILQYKPKNKPKMPDTFKIKEIGLELSVGLTGIIRLRIFDAEDKALICKAISNSNLKKIADWCARYLAAHEGESDG